MARHEELLPGGVRLSDVISLGVLAERVPIETVKAVVAASGRSSERKRNLPADFTALYVIALWLFRDVAYEEVLRCLLECVRWLGKPLVRVATKGAITQARERLGWEAMRSLHRELVAPLAGQTTKGAWYRRWRTIAVDGFTLDVQDTEENAKAFGYPGVSRGSSACPQIRCAALCETGTHALFAARMAPYATSEATLAKELVSDLKSEMLLLADRGLFGFDLWDGRERHRRRSRLSMQGQPASEGSRAPGRWLVPEQYLRKSRRPAKGRGRGQRAGRRIYRFRFVGAVQASHEHLGPGAGAGFRTCRLVP